MVTAMNELVEIKYLKQWGDPPGKPEVRSDKTRWYPYKYAHSYRGLKKAITRGEDEN